MEIIHSADLRKILKHAAESKAQCRLISLKPLSANDREALAKKGISEISPDEIEDSEKLACEREHIENIAEIGLKNQSIEWWANPASEKNEHVSELFNNLCRLYGFVRIFEKYANADIQILAVCDAGLFASMKAYCVKNNIEIKTLENFAWFKDLAVKLNALFRIFLFCAKLVIRKIYLFYALGFKPGRNDGSKKYYVMRTWLDNRFIKNNGIYNDSYFGRLPQYLEGQGYNVFILAGITGRYAETVRKINAVKEFQIAPEEFFLKLPDLLKALLHLKIGRTKLLGKILFRGIDATSLYEAEISKGYISANYLNNFTRYFIAKKLAEALKVGQYIQTFENYAWEKMSILGIKKAAPAVRVLGFQHAFISRNSFKYFAGRSERDVMPLPDRIVTMGRVTKEILEKFGSYKDNVLRIGCALRQEYLGSLPLLRRSCFKRVLVPLTMVPSESIATMNFIHEAGLGDSGIEVVFRCHPSALFESFSKSIEFEMPDNFIINNEKSIYDELKRTDMVLYTWTTVSVEALRLGLPVIYLGIFEYMHVDPLFECQALKKTVNKPKQLLPAIEGLYNLDDEIFYKEQEMAQKCLEEYFYPVTEENLASFMPDNSL